MAQKIVARFPFVARANLVYGDRCGICHELYSTNIAGSGTTPEDAVRLPCGHEFGFECISTWLSPEEGKNTCPLCRHQLFPRARAADESHTIHDENWIHMATALDSELRANGIVHRSRHFRDWLLYSQLLGQGANLPPWHPGSASTRPRLDVFQEDALFGELRRRGAFEELPVPVGPLVSERQVWDFLRDHEYYYDPVTAGTAGGRVWFQT